MNPVELRPTDDDRVWEHRLLPLLLTAFGIAVGATLGAQAPAMDAGQHSHTSGNALVQAATFLNPIRHLDDAMVQLQVSDVVAKEGENTSVVLLADKGSEHVLPLFVAASDGSIIERHLHGATTADKGDAQNLLRQSIEALGGEVDRVELDDNNPEALGSQVFVKKGSEEVALPAAPSDALALALSTGTPVFAPSRLVTAQGIDREALKHVTGGVPSTLKQPERL